MTIRLAFTKQEKKLPVSVSAISHDMTAFLKIYYPGLEQDHKIRSFRNASKMSRMLWLLVRHSLFYIPAVHYETEPHR